MPHKNETDVGYMADVDATQFRACLTIQNLNKKKPE
jgi:hypothetical protein